jgi:hypothetical protein
VEAQTAGSLSFLFEERTQQLLTSVLHHLTDIGPDLRGLHSSSDERVRRNFEHTVDFPAGGCDGTYQLIDVDIADLAAGPLAGRSAVKLQAGAAKPFASSSGLSLVR